ncbi:MAG: segregation/condensation protein A, partial [Phycisphaerae bacterium]|nr:segregation/condensation protein A [Phycisphaerae bacterium]
MNDYRVNLDIYNGPVDLLLYLIRRDEVDIYDIPISRITAQYMQHVDLIRTLDPDLAGEFLVMAATLMEIKTRMLLPTPTPQEADGDEPFDPRGELVRQLLEYKAFKDAAGDLRDAA